MLAHITLIARYGPAWFRSADPLAPAWCSRSVTPRCGLRETATITAHAQRVLTMSTRLHLDWTASGAARRYYVTVTVGDE
jgi:hypothetical protein